MNAVLDDVILNDPTISDVWFLKALTFKDSDWNLFSRYEARANENLENNLGIITKERFEQLRMAVNEDLVTMKFLNDSKIAFLSVAIDGRMVAHRVPSKTTVTIRVPVETHIVEVSDSETGRIVTRDKMRLVEGRVIRTAGSWLGPFTERVSG